MFHQKKNKSTIVINATQDQSKDQNVHCADALICSGELPSHLGGGGYVESKNRNP